MSGTFFSDMAVNSHPQEQWWGDDLQAGLRRQPAGALEKGLEKVSGTFFVFSGSSSGAERYSQGQFLRLVINPGRFTVGGAAIQAPLDGRKFALRLRRVDVLGPSRLARQRPGGRFAVLASERQSKKRSFVGADGSVAVVFS